ncbi:MAG: NUDIX hydrolase [Gammaproteobacteria bacterium]|nr:NUDIX hydrolase [Gammaproteobacteria bacterium]
MLHNPRITVATVVPVDGKYIIIEETINGQTVLNQPAGHVEEEESFVEAAQRETLEETGWTVAIDHLVGVYHLRVPGFNFIRFCFAATALEHTHPSPPDESILGVQYLDRQEIERNHERWRSPLVLTCIKDYESGHSIALDRLQYLSCL